MEGKYLAVWGAINGEPPKAAAEATEAPEMNTQQF